ncbi:S41 family peptidase [Flavobacterium sp. HJJ]|uniref:S41 family peptidase n=1 Tax=Flavobacterium sp. HJJ TaxID=2783792 RepID=UPI00188CB251|nr:S41 family peptidase [Flavobacterium sp. HJJ]MBF4470746.1 PDZ domain-containing protein [Flavobacterium sp. HJJ]
MRLKYIIPTLILGLVFTACSKDSDSNETTATKPDEINNFVWKAMNSWYYWQPNVTDLSDSKITSTAAYNNFINGKTPDALFYSLLYQRGTVDRFSWIENSNEVVYATKIAEVEKNGGFSYGIYPKDASSINMVALINYVVPGSPSALAGLKRGDVITKINGSQLTSSNYDQLENTQITITLAASVQFTSSSLVTTDKAGTVTVTKTEIDENPVAYYEKKIYGAKNIGYLVFNGFKSDYNDELNLAFAKMQSDGINELVLDLRYNGGGSVETAIALAQMINGSFTNKPYIYLDFNDKHNSEDGYENLSEKVKIFNLVDNQPTFQREESINSLALTKIYVLVSFQTASASELTIQCLKKYISVITIGEETVGKFVGSNTLYDSPAYDYTSYTNRSTKHKWQLQPITFSYYNKDKDANPANITPDYEINPYSIFLNLVEFGNVKDPCLKKAIELITGQTLRTTAKNTDLSLPFKIDNLTAFNPTNTAKGLYIEDFKRLKKQ